jgi:large subunit ribosomal protein L28
MSRVCYFTGKKPVIGRHITTRGIAKKKGGIGLKTTGITTRRFLPNLQTVKIITENGTVKRVRVCASYLTSGNVKRAPKRTWKPASASSQAQA